VIDFLVPANPLAMVANCYADSSSLLVMKEISMTTSVEISSEMTPSPLSVTAAERTVDVARKRISLTAGVVNDVVTTLTLCS
jgi:hypothetical protein